MGIISACLLLLAIVAATEGRQCYRKGQYYDPGSTWVDSSCKWRCTCYQGGHGRYRCLSLCYNLFTTTCGYHEITKYRKVKVLGSECQCDEPYCVKKPKTTKRPDVCYDYGQPYNVGESYIDRACKWRCKCNPGGRVSCSSLCPTYTVRCASNKVKVNKRVAVPGSSRCFCDKPTCVHKRKPRCYYYGTYYNAGQSWVDSTCTWQCTCGNSGRYQCTTFCPSYSVTCSSNQIKQIKQRTFPGSTCKCRKVVCVDDLSRVCQYGGKRYYLNQVFMNEACTDKCKCGQEGRVSCVDLCPSYPANCGPNQIEKEKRVAISGSNCYCNRTMCVDKPKVQCYYHRDRKYYDADQSWIDSSCTYRCNCDTSRRYKCTSLCSSKFLTCGKNQMKQTKQEDVPGSNCKCPKHVCVDRPKPKKVQCYVNGAYYDPGQTWIDSQCSWRCNCYSAGRYRCNKLCPSYTVTCSSDQIKQIKQVEVPGSNCKCNRPVCVKRLEAAVLPQPPGSCNHQGKVYAIGQSFVDATCSGKCKCNQGGRISCVSLCRPVTIHCGNGQTKKYMQVPVPGSSCSCRRPYCENPVYCNFRGYRYKAGESFVDPSCRWSCDCDARGLYKCKSACVYISKRCGPTQMKMVRYVPVKNSKKCRCRVPYCKAI